MMRLGHKHRLTHRLGVKEVVGSARAGLKHSGSIADKAEMVESVAGKVAGGLGAAATLTALTGGGVPLAGALASAGGAIGAIGKGAGVVGGIARKGQRADEVISRAERVNQAINTL